MDGWIRWSAPAAAIAIALPAFAYQYSTVGTAQHQAFPGARFEEIQSQRVWKALVGDRLIGFFFVDHVIGKHLYIDYSVAIGADGRVRRVEILTTGNPTALRWRMRAGLRNSPERRAAARSKSILTFAISRARPCRRGM